ncbi:PLP-dependent aminotransferase family protein [Spirochaeta isovalerica]|uniref:GntR family transcriptional regulator/MocR family aminotransferase n=1 Tax=Spirochaeta isovalerica TaxID=150 RepID=A0A841RD61_9SPIO|nr:PLP-dependent aminotransferase family protein [Spirochaeta isovalerica]MBB6480930.1 GntR family transcriptional regulator/MocR family aminotransferase [Spirochaeta isovalerica]
MYDISIDRLSKEPLYRQIRDRIIELINSGELKSGNQLPPSRELAMQLGVNRTTVYQAYRELWSLGYTESRPGSYSIVRNRKETNQPVNRQSELIDWKALINTYDPPFRSSPEQDEALYDFRTFSPLSDAEGAEKFRKCLNDVLRQKGKDLLLYGDPYGYRPLRDYISLMMSENEIDVDRERILITDGAQNGLDLICKLFRKEKWSIVTAEPSYSEALSLFHYYGAEVISIPLTSSGMDLAELQEKLKNNTISFVYTMPNFQNPTGISSTRENREELLEICENSGVPIIEDGFSQDMRGTILPIKSMDRHGIVIYIGTFSKVLFPGIRVGWINGNRDILKKLAALQYMTSVSGNHIMQAAVERFCRLGYYDLHLKRIHRRYRERMTGTLDILKQHFPRKAGTYTSPAGGFYLWFDLSQSFQSEEELILKLKERGILITGGSLFMAERKGGTCLRMSIARGEAGDLEKGVIAFCKVLKAMLKEERK